MIALGQTDTEKRALIAEKAEAMDAKKIVIISPERFIFEFNHPIEFEWLEWADAIEYSPFYRLLQEIDRRTLVVINEGLRTQNRNDLTYNCIRHYLNQCGDQLIFQYLPQIDTREDFCTLYDFDTQSKWKRYKFNAIDLEEAQITGRRIDINFTPIITDVSDSEYIEYVKYRQKLFSELGNKDPDTLPRNLYLYTGKFRIRAADKIGGQLVGRNKRFQKKGVTTYSEPGDGPYAIFEFPHRFIDFSDFIYRAEGNFDVLVSRTEVDRWYMDRYERWLERLDETYANIF
jgi:hypothetical protein